MILYVDETASTEYFIVTGLLVEKATDIETAYKRFKKQANRVHLSPKQKSILFTEFKSTIMDSDFQKLKTIMLKELNKFEYCAIYSCYVKKSAFGQSVKEKVYTALLMKIVSAIKENIDIIFDTFNKQDFENDVIECLLGCPNVTSIKACDSQKEVGIQFVDNLCSVFRLHRTNRDTMNFYSIIKPYVVEV